MSLGRRRSSPLVAVLATLALVGSGEAHAAERRLCALLPWVAEAFGGPEDGVAVVAAVPRYLGAAVPVGTLDLGNPHAPSLEVLAAARCELIVADGRIHRATQAALEQVGGELLWLDGGGVEATLASLERVAQHLAAEAAVRERVAAVRQELAAGGAVRRAQPLRVLALFGAPGAWRVMTRHSWLGDLLTVSGFTNLGDHPALAATTQGFAALSDEVLLGLSPDLVLLVAHGDPAAVLEGFRREASQRPAFSRWASSARTLDPALFGSNPGLQMPAAAAALEALAHQATAVSPR